MSFVAGELGASAMRNPFPGLRAFRADEEFLFFGRESQVDTMVDKLSKTHFLAVVGTSGSGKSSLVSCGLRPALHRGLMVSAGSSWRVAQFRPGGEPIRAMAQALAADGVLFTGFESEGLPLEQIVDATLRMSRLGLVDIYGQSQIAERQHNLLVVVDQFEELFRFRDLATLSSTQSRRSQDAIAFVNLLLEATAQPDSPIYVVLTMRSDFLGDCAQLPGLPEAINEGQYLVPRMKREDLRSAITGPIGTSGAEISPVLLTRLVNDVDDTPDQLSILQHALSRTWARWQQDRTTDGELALPHYEAIGTMARALDRHAEKAFAALADARQREIAESVFKALTDKSTAARGIRRPTSFGTLCQLTAASPIEVSTVIDVFRRPSRSFLMPPLAEVLKPETVIDISHESLMRAWSRLKHWVDDEAEAASRFRRLAESAAMHARGATGLMTDPELSITVSWWETVRPNAAWAQRYQPGFEAAELFLAASRRAHEAAVAKEKRRRDRARWARRFLVGALVVGVVAGGLGYALQAKTAEDVATTAKLETQKAQKATIAAQQARTATTDAESAQRVLKNVKAKFPDAVAALPVLTAMTDAESAEKAFEKILRISKLAAVPKSQQRQSFTADVGIGGGQTWQIDWVHRIFKGPDPLGENGERIAVDSRGHAWVVTTTQEILHWTGFTWRSLPGSATDIAVGADGTVGIVDTSGDNTRCLRWNETRGNWEDDAWKTVPVSSAGVAIAIDPQGEPWFVDAEGSIWRYQAGEWQALPGLATDISIGTDGAVFIIGARVNDSAYMVYRWSGDAAREWQQVKQVTGEAWASGFRAAVETANHVVLAWPALGRCFWMTPDGTQWLPMNMSLYDCYQSDCSDGKECTSGGGCYKWAPYDTAERQRWDELGCPDCRDALPPENSDDWRRR